MSLKEEEIQRLMVRFLLGEITSAEQQQLDNWRKEDVTHAALFDTFCNCRQVRAHLQGYLELDVNKALKRNQRMLRKPGIRKILKKSLPYAALVVMVFGAIAWWSWPQRQKVLPLTAQEINPVGCQAELILGNGESVLLNAGADTRIREGESDIRINGNNVNYFSDSSSSAALVYNTIRTPLGGEYSVILADGTKVWLNAMSELRYPVSFNTAERRVELKGEAYFKVKKDSLRPFYVTIADYQVKVLGTSFNISAYADQPVVQTTLCTGKVNVCDLRTNRPVVLSPGEQANWNRQTRQIEVTDVDADLFRAWTRGEFRFDNTPIEEIFRILQRWYKIDVFYANNSVKEEVFSGKLPRFDNLQVILEIMEKVSDVKFEMQGNTLVIK